MICYVKSLFDSPPILLGSACLGVIAAFLFPESFMFTATLSALIMIVLDALTRLYAQSKKSGGFIKAIKNQSISSRKLFDGTIEKLMILGVLLIVSGCAYMLSPITLPARMLVYGFFILMFSRDLTSIFENLIDAGYKNILPFKRFAEKKVNDAFDSLSSDVINVEKVTPPKESTVSANSDDLPC